MYKQITKELIDFITASTDCYHAVQNIKAELDKVGYKELLESESWDLKKGGRYYTTRNLSSIIAFEIPQNEYNGFMITASHCDSPTYKLKPQPIVSDGTYARLSVEKYGGPIASSWLDRPLGISGRLAIKTENGIKIKLVKTDRDIVVIPSLAIHLEREVKEPNTAVDMLPLASCADGDFMDSIAKFADVKADDIIAHDLFLYNRTHGSIWGCEDEYFSVARLDDLQCVYSALKGFVDSKKTDNIKMYCVFDNEEVGNETKQGAKSTFLTDVVERINSALGYDGERLKKSISSSFMVSADNAHAVHPNRSEMSDKTSRPVLNGGVVIKNNANQRYTTDSVSEAIFKSICDKANVPYQSYTNRSDLRGGTTLGNAANEKLSLNTIDIGAPQLAMHSSYETGGTKDTMHMIQALTAFYSASVKVISEYEYEIN